MQKYIQPAVKVQKLESESLMAANSIGINNEYSGQPQRSKANNNWLGGGSSLWDEDETDTEDEEDSRK